MDVAASPHKWIERSNKPGASTETASPLAVSLIVPVYNGGGAFEDCLRSLRAMVPAVTECIVVDDGCSDGSADRARGPETWGLRRPTASGCFSSMRIARCTPMPWRWP